MEYENPSEVMGEELGCAGVERLVDVHPGTGRHHAGGRGAGVW